MVSCSCQLSYASPDKFETVIASYEQLLFRRIVAFHVVIKF